MSLIAVPLGNGVVLSWATSSGGSYTAFAHIEDVTGFKIKSPEVKTTKVDDTSETSVPGIPDWGSVGLKIRHQVSLVTTITGWQTARTLIWLKLAPQDADTPSTQVVQAYVMEYDPYGTLKLNTEVVAGVEFKITGAATYVAGT